MSKTPQHPCLSESNQRPIRQNYSKTAGKSSDQSLKDFDEKFASDSTHHSCALTSDGCMSRHYIPRKKQYLSRSESRARDFAGFNRVEFEDQQLIGMVAELQSKGYALRSDESLQEYVIRHRDELSLDAQERLERSQR